MVARMTGRVVIRGLGGPEVLEWEQTELPRPSPGEARIRQTAIGMNFIDVYYRTGLYRGPVCPFVPGMEAAGVVEALGDGVTTVKVGDRVAYASVMGAYAEARNIAAERLVPLPNEIDDRTGAAMMLKGMTAEYLLCRTYSVRLGDTILIHAAAGGVGLIACQWAKHLGATVIGTVSSDEKARIASEHGCDYPIVYTRENFVERVREITRGAGVPVVYDSVGKDTFSSSLDCLAPRGILVLFGQSSGKVEPLDPAILAAKGSLYLTRPVLMTYIASREDLLMSSRRLFDVVRTGAVHMQIGQTYALRDVATAHRDLEARKTKASTVLLPAS